jgi:hypothetical protein
VRAIKRMSLEFLSCIGQRGHALGGGKWWLLVMIPLRQYRPHYVFLQHGRSRDSLDPTVRYRPRITCPGCVL